jgi:hypothetical protein
MFLFLEVQRGDPLDADKPGARLSKLSRTPSAIQDGTTESAKQTEEKTSQTSVERGLCEAKRGRQGCLIGLAQMRGVATKATCPGSLVVTS